MRKAKLLAKQDRDREKQRRAEEQHSLKENALRLKALEGGFSRTPVTPEQRKAIKAKLAAEAQQAKFGRLELYEPLKARIVPQVTATPRESVKYEGQMLERELKALQETELRKKQVAPLGNKMGYQYVTGQDLEDFKSGLTRRR